MESQLNAQKAFFEFVSLSSSTLPSLYTYTQIANTQGYAIGNYYQNIRYSPLVHASQVETVVQLGKQLIHPNFTIVQSQDAEFYIPLFYSSPSSVFPITAYGLDLFHYAPTKSAFFDKFPITSENINNTNIGENAIVISDPIKLGASRDDFDLGIYIGNMAFTSNNKNNSNNILGFNYIAILLRDYVDAIIANTNAKFSNVHVHYQLFFNHTLISRNNLDMDLDLDVTYVLSLFGKYELRLYFAIEPSNLITFQQFLLQIILPCLYGIIVFYLLTIYYYSYALFLFQVNKIKEINNMITYVNHELRNPLNIVYGMAQIIQLKTKQHMELELELGLESKQTHFFKELYSNISTVINSVRCITLIVNDVLDLQKLEENRLEVDIQPYSWRELMYDFKKSVIHKLYEAHHNVTTIIEDEYKDANVDSNVDSNVDLESNVNKKNVNKTEDLFYTDKNRLLQILVNLYTNAVKYTFEGSIVIKKERCKDCIKIYMTDTGCGISEKMQSQIFKTIIMKTNNNYNSTGIGLYICQLLANRLNHKLYFSSSRQGTTFVLEIPL